MQSTMSRRGFVAGAALASMGLAATSGLAPMMAKASENDVPDEWDYEGYDVVVCGAGGSGLLAALKAADEGCKVLCIDANFDTGGHACVSFGITHSGGGTSYQIENGIRDSPNQYYTDHTNPSAYDSRYNRRDVVRECADRMVECFEWMRENGLKLHGDIINGVGAGDCDTVARSVFCDSTGYVNAHNGKMNEGETSGIGVTRPFEESGRTKGVDFMMNRHMDSLIVDESGRVVGLRASYTPRTLKDGSILVGLHADEDIDETREEITIKAEKAVILATGGGSGNKDYRMMFDSKWDVQMDGCAGEPYSYQDASGEIAGLAIGAGLSGVGSWVIMPSMACVPAQRLGCRNTYVNHMWGEESPVWEFCGAKGLLFSDWDGVIQVNMQGKRFYNEDAGYNEGVVEKDNYCSAALGSVILDEDTDACRRVGGPIWAIFDSTYAEKQDLNCDYPDVDIENGYFFSGETLEELAANIVNKYYEDYPMDAANLVASVKAYNAAVDSGEDPDFARPADTMTQKIETGPFYAAWCTPNMHDCLTGLKTDGHRQVLTIDERPIEGLFACGECAGGHRTHGLGKVQTAGYIAGLYASQA